MVKSKFLTSLKGLRLLPQLKGLYLACKRLETFSPLKYLSLLQYLTILKMNTPFYYMKTLKHCTILEELTIGTGYFTKEDTFISKPNTSIKLLDLSKLLISKDEARLWVKNLSKFVNLTHLFLGSLYVPMSLFQALPFLKVVKCIEMSKKKIKYLQD